MATTMTVRVRRQKWPRRLFYRFGGRRGDLNGPWATAPVKAHLDCDLCGEARRVRANKLRRPEPSAGRAAQATDTIGRGP
jgi:hypothetical protein